MTQVHCIFDRLHGCWRLTRSITPDVTMTGIAVFTRSAPRELSYREHGELRLGSGQRLQAERCYIFRAAPQGFAVHFAEPPFRLFHDVALLPEGNDMVGRATHCCGNDLYVSEYRFAPDGDFAIRHKVTGPHKDYVSVTHYERAAAAASE